MWRTILGPLLAKSREERAKWVATVCNTHAVAIFFGVVVAEFVNPAIDAGTGEMIVASLAWTLLLAIGWFALKFAATREDDE